MGESEVPGGGGVRFLIENPRGEGCQEGEGPRGREGVCGELGEFLGGGGGPKYFLSGPKLPPRFVGAHISPKNTGFGPHRPCVRCIVIRIARLGFIGVVFVPRRTAAWPARVGRIR